MQHFTVDRLARMSSQHVKSSWSQLTPFIHLFIHFWHAPLIHYECVVPDVDINLQNGRFWATSIASLRKRFTDFRSCWVVFIHEVRGHTGGLLQFFKGKLLRSAWHDGIWFVWHSRNVDEKGKSPCLNSSRKVRLLSFPSHIIISHMVVPFDSQQFTQTPLIKSINLVHIRLGN